MRSAVLAIALALIAQVAGAADCSKQLSQAAERSVDHLTSWNSVYRFFKDYGACYDAGIAEGANDAIQRLWEYRWDSLPIMISLTSKDSAFKEFIWARLRDEDFPEDTLNTIVEHATARCPTGAKEFCEAVKSQSSAPAA